MTAFADISGALDGHLNTLVNKPGIAWENRPFTPIKGELYLRATILPADTLQAGLGNDGIDRHIGIYQVDVLAEAGTNKKAAYEQADSVADHFARGTDLPYNSLTVRIGNVSRGQAIRDGDRFIIPVFIDYSSNTQPR